MVPQSWIQRENWEFETHRGDVVLVFATLARHEELARVPVLDGRTWNHPVVADGHLLVRNLLEMAAFDP